MVPTKTDVLGKLEKLPNSTQEAEIIVKDVIPHLSRGEVSLHEVVESLGSSLTHASAGERGAGTRLLADLLHALPRNNLSSAQLTFLVSFFVDRLKDQHSVVPNVFYAYLALVEQERIEGDDVRRLIQGMFREVHCQSHIMSDRRNIYTFLKYCLIHKLEDVKPLGSDFILGLVSAVDGERDPRNLVLVFSLMPIVVASLPPGPFTEDLFEVIAAYFPIDFIPPANDPYGISQEDLVLGLRRSLSSTPAFAQYCLPLLQEKLDSDLTSAKLDSLHTLVSCCEVYSSEDIRPYVTPLWLSIRREVSDGSNEDVEQAALSALTAIAAALGRGPISPAALQASHTLVQSALAECVVHLRTPEQRLMFPSARLLLALVSAGQGPATTITNTVLPLLAEQLAMKTEEAAQRNTVIILGKFLGAAAVFPDLLAGSLSQHEEVWWTALNLALTRPSPQVREAAVAALTAALKALSPSRLPSAATALTTALLDTHGSQDIRSGVVECLATLGRLHPSATLDHVLPQLLAQLKTESHSEVQLSRESQVLDTLAALTLGPALLARVLPLLWGQTEAALAKEEGGGEKEGKEKAERAARYLTCIKKILGNTLNEPECQSFVLSEWHGVGRAVSVAVGVILNSQHTAMLPTLLTQLSAIIRLMVATLSEPQSLVNGVVRLVTGDKVEPDCELAKALTTHPEMQNLLAGGLVGAEESLRPRYMVYVLEGVLLGARCLPESTVGVLGQLRAVGGGKGAREGVEREEEAEVRKVAAILHAAIINKFPQGPTLTQVLNETHVDLKARLDPGLCEGERRSALLVAAWTCKALVVRGAAEQEDWSNWLLDLLSDPTLGMDAAHSFGIIVRDHQYALTPQTCANIRLLHKQRFFEGIVGPLVTTFSTAENAHTKSCALVAIASLLPCLPPVVLNSHINKLLPVLLQGLSTTNNNRLSKTGNMLTNNDTGGVTTTNKIGAETRESSLTTLASVLKQSASAALPHIGTLVMALLPLTSQHPLMVRVKALECLAALSTLPVTAILPYRDEVVRGLRAALDDRKRVVRQEATHTRCLWILVGAPGHSLPSA